jgi:hypothetical protein
MNSFHIKKFNKVKFVYGILFVLLGIALPSFLTVETFRIPEHLYLAIRSEDAVYLLMSGLGLVALNSLRAFPHYLGAFFIAESVEIRDSFPFEKLFKSALVCLIIPPVYGIIGVVHHVKYYFGVPAIVLLLLLEKGDANYRFPHGVSVCGYYAVHGEPPCRQGGDVKGCETGCDVY